MHRVDDAKENNNLGKFFQKKMRLKHLCTYFERDLAGKDNKFRYHPQSVWQYHNDDGDKDDYQDVTTLDIPDGWTLFSDRIHQKDPPPCF